MINEKEKVIKINELSRDVQKEILKGCGMAIQYIDNPDKELQLEAVKENGGAIRFIENPDNLPQVNHKDEDKTNNNVDNLEWCDVKYNLSYGTERIRERDTKIKNGWWTGLSKKEYRKKYYEENRDKIKEYMRNYSHIYYIKKKEQIQNNVH